MQKIASFRIDHDILQKGRNVLPVVGDVVTNDIRMKRPNQGGYPSNASLHTFGHLFAINASNTELSQGISYLEHDLAGAKMAAVVRLKALKDWTSEDMKYEA